MITSCAPVLAIVFFSSALLLYSSWPVFFFHVGVKKLPPKFFCELLRKSHIHFFFPSKEFIHLPEASFSTL